MISVSAVFDQQVAVAFLGDAVSQLFDQTMLEQGKNTTKLLSSLVTYDVEEFHVERETLYQQNLFESFHAIRESDDQSFLHHVKITDSSVIRDRLREFDNVITD